MGVGTPNLVAKRVTLILVLSQGEQDQVWRGKVGEKKGKRG